MASQAAGLQPCDVAALALGPLPTPPMPPRVAALRSEINLDELSGGAKINRIFFERFPYELNKVYCTYRCSGVAIEYSTEQYSTVQ
jgi:hypothetical protein